MTVFAPLRTRRLDVRLRELSIGDELDLCALPEGAHEKAITELLTRAVESAAEATPRHLTDVRAWSVGERLLALANYCMHVREDGPDYAVTEVSVLSDYLDPERAAPHDPEPFKALGDTWTVIELSGAAAEVIEALQPGTDLKGRAHWLFGAMAAQMMRAGEDVPDAVNDTAAYTEWLIKRIDVLRAFPSSGYEELYARYCQALHRDAQFFKIWFDDSGVIVLPKEAGAVTPPARFHVFAGIGELATGLAGKAH